MSLVSRIFLLVVLLPIAVILIMLSVANRHAVTLALDPFRPENAALSLTAPFFVYLFAALIVGMIVGGTATWIAQGKYRRKARRRKYEASLWQDEAERARTAKGLPADRTVPASRTA